MARKQSPKAYLPTILVVLGTTGDLMAKKIAPALYHLHRKGALPKLTRIVGVSRRTWSDKEYQNFVRGLLNAHPSVKDKKSLGSFLNLFSFSEGEFRNTKMYHALRMKLKAIDDAWGICSNKLFYLAVPPELYGGILKNLARSGLTAPCSPEEGWTRVLIEKPFGTNLTTAQALDALLSTLFKEIQIYRIDHYLAKEMLQNILSFRFSNSIFEGEWNNSAIERIDIRLLETLGVEKRGSFYDGLGALLDVGQNHLLQMLALVTMDQPEELSAEAIRTKRAEILKTLIPLSPDEVRRYTFRAQYRRYLAIPGVRRNSKTETYFKAVARLAAPQFSGVPIILEAGKRIGKDPLKEIVVTFKHPTPCLCPRGAGHLENKIIFQFEPREEIRIQFWSKKPGLTFEIEKKDFTFSLRGSEEKSQYVEEYEKLLLDCIAGDQTLFVRSDEVQAMWRYIDSITPMWKKGVSPLRTYTPDTKQAPRESQAVDEVIKLQKKRRGGEIAIAGLGKMGLGLALRLKENGWRVRGYDPHPEVLRAARGAGIKTAGTLKDLMQRLKPPRTLWLMIPAGAPVDEVIFGTEKEKGVVSYLKKGDVIIDGGNSFYKDTVRRERKLKRYGIGFVDVGVSGGPRGARHGACLMIGGKEELYRSYEPLFHALAVKNGYAYIGKSGAGHFVKMVHNGIEYGMMEALAEGFTVFKKAPYHFNLEKVADLYGHGSVIESRLVSWLKDAYQQFGPDLRGVSGSVAHTGEGEWTVQTAKEFGIPFPVIENALTFRKESLKKPSYTGKILSALRNQFGGHGVRLNAKKKPP